MGWGALVRGPPRESGECTTAQRPARRMRARGSPGAAARLALLRRPRPPSAATTSAETHVSQVAQNKASSKALAATSRDHEEALALEAAKQVRRTLSPHPNAAAAALLNVLSRPSRGRTER